MGTFGYERGRVASAKQVAFINKLFGEKDLTGTQLENLTAEQVTGLAKTGNLSQGVASDYIVTLKGAPYRGGPKVPAEPTVFTGMYRTSDGSIYKVQASRSTGRPYAKKLVTSVECQGHVDQNSIFLDNLVYCSRHTMKTCTAKKVVVEFVYASGAVYRLTDADRMPLEQVAAFGLETGTCAWCGRELSNPESVALGIGPVCAKRI